MPIASILIALIDLAKTLPELAAALEHLFHGGQDATAAELVNRHAQAVIDRNAAVAAADASKA